MSPPSLIASTSIDHDEPDWKPLEDLLGVDLVGAFMWMFEVDLADGTSVHAYKHVATRAYIYLAVDGRTFVYVRSDHYREIPPHVAVALAFDGWEGLQPQPRQPNTVRDALRRIQAAHR